MGQGRALVSKAYIILSLHNQCLSWLFLVGLLVCSSFTTTMDYLPTSTSLVALPLLPRPLKRSASAASLPTPPRTRHKRKSKGGRSEGGDTDSGSDQDDNKAPNPQNKRQKTTVGVEEDEDAFWLGALDAKNKGKVVATQPDDTAKVSTVEAPVSPATALVRRRQQRNVALVAPVSPPPSHRKTRSATAKAKVSASPALTTLSSPPATPRVERPVRDTPNNPFLVPATPMNKFVDEQFFPKTPPKAKEGPTITYVLYVLSSNLNDLKIFISMQPWGTRYISQSPL